jgi:hypothetical protein
MFAKMKAALRDYFIPEQPNDYMYYMNEYGMFPFYHDDAENELAEGLSEPSYVQPFPEKQ